MKRIEKLRKNKYLDLFKKQKLFLFVTISNWLNVVVCVALRKLENSSFCLNLKIKRNSIICNKNQV